MRRIRQAGAAGLALATLAALGLGTASVASPQDPDLGETQAATSTAVDWSGLGQAPCPEGMTRRVSVDSHSMDSSVPQPRFNDGWGLVSSRDGSAARATVSSSDASDHLFLPYVKVSVDRRTMLGLSTRSTQGNSAYTRAQVNSVDLRVYAGQSWGGRVYDVTAATDDENGHLGTWFEHRSRNGASTRWDLDNVQIYTCRDAPVSRISGADRYASAARIAATYPAGVEVAYLATGENFPDAIGASALAGRQDAPVLLTRTGQLPSDTAAQLRRLSPERLVVLGGTGAVSDTVARQAGAYADSTTRITGRTRYDVSAGVARGYSPGGPVLYVASGDDFPDALSIGALAGHQGAPVLLTPKAGLHPAVEEQVARLDPGRIVVVGGSGAVSDTVLTQLRRHTSGTVARISGSNRYAVASAIAQEFDRRPARAYVATGTAFPDALVGAARAGSQGVPVVLTRQDQLVSDGRAALQALDPLRGVLLGGQVALSSVVMDQVGAHVG
ncbi:N-acetylmuramoyl-L-alanine amidase [Serinicoccus hydrothermalis]|uniref:N-acetylmuramoyl-L-alanine amidase n=1 Tax=Serinicoccus hydrothermalis TaxID=1758689 RepID=A0A1B1NCG0_9MICO|nr:cell wall-binding repeat-containing protein [Serinicoccus hydrothermalis]ANS79117.1 N-acetylmuramoyl-L-alanine amidase [Serinicoccus hydrothermalis]